MDWLPENRLPANRLPESRLPANRLLVLLLVLLLDLAAELVLGVIDAIDEQRDPRGWRRAMSRR
ncbi:MAG: hypothetical protein WAM11_13760 [Cyanobium sp.]